MKYGVWLTLVLAFCAGCVSTLVRRGDGTTTYEQSGFGAVDPVAVSTSGYNDARADTERAWGDTLREDPELVFDFLRDTTMPWRLYGYGGYGQRPGYTNPCYYGVCGTQMPVAPAGGVQ